MPTISPLWLEQPADWGRFPDSMRSTEAAREIVGIVPLLAQRRPVGVLSVSFPQRRRLDLEQRRFVEAVGRRAAQALDNVRRAATSA